MPEVDVNTGGLAPDLAQALLRGHVLKPNLVGMFLAGWPASWCWHFFSCIVELEIGPRAESRALSSSWCIGILVWRRFSENEYANPHGRGESEAGELDASDLLTLAPNTPLAREAD